MAAFEGLPETGTSAPQFALKSQDGTAVRLSDLKGKWVVLCFHPKDFTSGGTVEAHNSERDLASYEKRNAAIVGVSVDGVDSHRVFCAKEGSSFKLLADTEHTVAARVPGEMQSRPGTLLSSIRTGRS
jgi:peroxiredoxin Q/BCP